MSAQFTLPFFKASDQTFAGSAEELKYTEVKVRGIEYQVGYGYVLIARQQDAKPSTSGDLDGVALSVAAQSGFTRFIVSLIGVAPDDPAAKCETPPAPTHDPLLCAIDTEPAVTAKYYYSALGQLSAAFAHWEYPDRPTTAPDNGAPIENKAPPPVCPQVINYRVVQAEDGSAGRSPSKVGAQVALSPAQLSDLYSILKQLEDVCPLKRPNAHLSFKNGAPFESINANLANADETGSQTRISQGYYRNRIYLADTALRRSAFYDPQDQFVEVYVDGLRGAASLPSLLAAVITLNTSVQDQRVHAYTQCSDGADAINPKAFGGSGDDAETQLTTYTDFVKNLRAAVDANPGRCANARPDTIERPNLGPSAPNPLTGAEAATP